MTKSKTIQIFLKDAIVDGIKIADLSNSTARVYVIPREQIDFTLTREELSQPALYMLFDDERTTVYVGESENFNNRIGNHVIKKDFWQWAVVCITVNTGLDKAEVKFLESHAIQKAIEINRFNVQNRTKPPKNNLHEFKLASTLGLFDDFELLITTLGFNLFESIKNKKINKKEDTVKSEQVEQDVRQYDTVICPATGDGRSRVFEKQNAWWAVRIGQNNISKLKYIGLYEGSPVSSIRYYARITKIEPYQDAPGKYIIHHNGNIMKLKKSITLDKHPNLALFGPRYYKLEDIKSSKNMAELTDKTFGSNYSNEQCS